MRAENVNMAATLIDFDFEVDAAVAFVTLRLWDAANDEVLALAVHIE